MKAIFFNICLIIGTSTGQPTEKECCLTKTVGDIRYNLVSEGEVPPDCKSGCIYMNENDPTTRFCFATGNLPVSCGAELDVCTCDANVTDTPKRIIEGHNEDKAKWQVALVLENPPGHIFCGGSLITDNSVVTAAHCLFDFDPQKKTWIPKSSFKVWVGLRKKNSEAGVQKIAVEDYKPHINWNPNTNENDIAIITLATAAAPRHERICLPTNVNDNYVGKCATTTGWGLINQNPDEVPTILQGLQSFKIYSNKLCQTYWLSTTHIFPTMICLGDTVPDKGTCDGDSGGPLVYTTKTGNIEENTLIGITSFGPKNCRNKNLPSVFTRVTKYVDWIKDEMDGSQPDSCHVSRSSNTCMACC